MIFPNVFIKTYLYFTSIVLKIQKNGQILCNSYQEEWH